MSSATKEAKRKIDLKIGRWSDIKPSAYIIIISEAKERFLESVSESESITDKSIKMATGFLAYVGFFTAYLIKSPSLIFANLHLLLWTFFFVMIEIAILGILSFPKKVKSRGLIPEFFIPEKFNSKEDVEYQDQLLYYTGIICYQENIDFMLLRNKNRIFPYKTAIVGLILLLPLLTCVTCYVICQS